MKVRCDECRQEGALFAIGYAYSTAKVNYPCNEDEDYGYYLESRIHAFSLCTEFCARKFWRACGGAVVRERDGALMHLRWEPQLVIADETTKVAVG